MRTAPQQPDLFVGLDTGARQEAAAVIHRPAPQPAPEASRLSREQVLDRILEMNPGATTEFLLDFDDRALAGYLERLLRLHDRRGATSRWVRPAGPPAVLASDRLRWKGAPFA